jgi:hypothetical protein
LNQLGGTCWKVTAAKTGGVVMDLKLAVQNEHGISHFQQAVFVAGQEDPLDEATPLDPDHHAQLFLMIEPSHWEVDPANAPDVDANAEFIRTVQAGDLAATQGIIRSGHPINFPGTERTCGSGRTDYDAGKSALYWSCRGGPTGGSSETEPYLQMTLYLLGICPAEHLREYLDMSNALGFTAIFAAAAQGRPKSLAMLVEAGADVLHTDHRGLTASAWAQQNGHAAIVAYLQKAMKPPSSPKE